jgi:DHA1 family bicyclomycin/chloramphenicol resistance-like MFS transporter
MRFFQGAAASVGPVLGRAVVRDHFSADEAAQRLSSLMVVLAVAPLVAPLIGARLLGHFGWQAIFWTLGGAGVALFALVALFLGESLPARDPQALAPRQLARRVGTFLGDRACLAHALVILFVFGAQFSFISGSPFVVIDVFHVPRDAYGYFFGATAACLMAGASLNRRLLSRGHHAARLLRLGLGVLVASGAVLAAAALAGGGVAVVFPPILVFFGGLGLVSPNATAAALEPVPRMAGVASSVLGVFQMVGGALAGWGVSLLYDHTARPMALSVAVLGATGAGVYAALVPRRPQAA